jgi:hypothetical protein
VNEGGDPAAVADDRELPLADRREQCVSIRDGQPFSVGGLTIRGGKIVEMDILADPERIARLDLTILDD